MGNDSSSSAASPTVNPPMPPPPLPIGKKETITVPPKSHTVYSFPKPLIFFQPEINTTEYLDYVKAATKGKITPLINGRNTNGLGPNIELTEPLNAMEAAVRATTGAGDFVYLGAWLFEPKTLLTSGIPFPGATNWGDFLSIKAQAGVKVRVILNDFDPISGMDETLRVISIEPLAAVINAIPEALRDNFKFIVSLHPAHVGWLKSTLAGKGGREIFVASHHQKFMVVKAGNKLTSFCGGLDIESRKTPVKWDFINGPTGGWHDIHFQIEGLLAYDLESEFVQRWNREKGAINASKKHPTFTGWAPFETLLPTAVSAEDSAAELAVHNAQMLRTISEDGFFSASNTRRDDIIQAYKAVVVQSKTLLYLENQYFRDQVLADTLASRGKSNTALQAILVVVENAGNDDGANPVTNHGDYLQHLFFKKVKAAFGDRCRFYTMFSRAVHSKFILSDDLVMVGGSANGNARSFAMDSELNIVVVDGPLVTAFKQRLWAHNLGTTPAAVGGFTDILAEWDKVATANAALLSTPEDMAGEGVLAFDFDAVKGEKSLIIPDEFAYMDFDNKEPPHGEIEVVKPDVAIA